MLLATPDGVRLFADDGGSSYRSVDGGKTCTVLAAGVGPILSVGVQPE